MKSDMIVRTLALLAAVAAASLASALHGMIVRQHLQSMQTMQHIALARYNYQGDYTAAVEMPPCCTSCGKKVTGYTGRYRAVSARTVLEETNIPCGCRTHRVTFPVLAS